MRSAGTFLILLGLSGCVADGPQVGSQPFNQPYRVKEAKGVMGPHGTPLAMSARGKIKSPYQNGRAIQPAGGVAGMSGGVKHANYVGSPSGGIQRVNFGGHAGGPGGGQIGAPNVPPMGPPGAVAAVGAIPPGAAMQLGNSRTSVRFGTPAGMTVSWLTGNGFGEHVVEVPGRYNFRQGGIYRLKLSSIPTRPNMVLYPTIEVLPANHKTATFLAHSSVPVNFTEQDFEQVDSGNFLIKVIYLPDPEFQDLAAIAGPAEIISTRLEPGLDPIIEAQRRGSILVVVRVGNIDLQAPNTPSMAGGLPGVPSGGVLPGSVVPNQGVPGGVLPGSVVPNQGVPGGVLPGSIVPDQGIPGGVMPGGIVPNGVVPGTTVPGGSPMPGMMPPTMPRNSTVPGGQRPSAIPTTPVKPAEKMPKPPTGLRTKNTKRLGLIGRIFGDSDKDAAEAKKKTKPKLIPVSRMIGRDGK